MAFPPHYDRSCPYLSSVEFSKYKRHLSVPGDYLRVPFPRPPWGKGDARKAEAESAVCYFMRLLCLEFVDRAAHC